uniref:Uncharacterized protein P0446G09.118 n=2 Tax=Oryza sativa subsp. japonica TaxID=39947 RepID=Q7EYU2_ORYSJ|nr:hypothetical protein [Oryza sativa Japonica Group]BAD31735.1 hypothetical protein [Oryza sativa Japonica Group]
MTQEERAMRRMATFSSSPRRLLRRIRRRCFSTTSFPNPTMRSSMVTSSPLSLKLFFFSYCSAPSPASSPNASRLFFRYRILHTLPSDWIEAENTDRTDQPPSPMSHGSSNEQKYQPWVLSHPNLAPPYNGT